MSTEHHCSDCGHRSPRWFGRCPECGSWSTADESGSDAASDVRVRSLTEAVSSPPRLPTRLQEFDRVLGGGLVAGSVVLLAGEPGIGKSTLILQMLDGIMSGGHTCLLTTGEESLDQVGLRAHRLGVAADRVRAVATTSLNGIVAACSAEAPAVVVVDSIQTVEPTDEGAGSVAQIRDAAARLVRHAKETGTVVVLTGHVTKDGAVAGPKTLEHMVDVVLALDGERTGTLRLLRAVKNRFGSCDETGVFVMSENGLQTVEDPSAFLLTDRHPGLPGSVVFPSLEGSRPVLVEVQALVTGSKLPQPRRVAIGLDPRRLALILGVLSKRKSVLAERDVFVAVAGGVVVREPAADLAVAMALWSSLADRSVDPGVVAVGEVGLGGEVRRVPGLERRLAEAERLGFTKAFVPRGLQRVPRRVEVHTSDDVGAALSAALSRPPASLAS
ncbi:MAG: DNA repair protein RadA [Actinomycetota bacterium]|nr:DNA repair protein RadA [Actinomycetota bacterium]